MHAKLISAVSLMVAIGAVSVSTADAETIKLTIGAGHPANALWNKTVIDFFMPKVAERVANETDHTIEWNEAWGGTLCKVEDCLEAQESGLLDIVNLQMPQEPSKLRGAMFSIFAPFSSTDPRIVAKAALKVYEEVPEITELFARYNIRPIAPGAVGNYGLITNFEWSNLDELKGKKIGAAGANIPWLDGTGLVGVQTTLNDAYTSMQTGVYDGFLNFASSHVSFKLYEVAKQFTSIGYGAQAFTVLAINMDSWEALPPEVQTIIDEVGREWNAYIGQAFYDDEQKSFEILRANGQRIYELPQDVRVAYANSLSNLAKTASEEINEMGQPGEAIYAYVRALKELGVDLPRDWEAER